MQGQGWKQFAPHQPLPACQEAAARAGAALTEGPCKSWDERPAPELFPRGIELDWIINHSLSGGG